MTRSKLSRQKRKAGSVPGNQLFIARRGHLYAAALLACTLSFPVHAQEDQHFEMHVRPLLVEKCYACHTEERMGGLQLDTREHAMKGGKDGAVIVPGDPEKSLLVQALRYTDPKLKMPPGGRLKDEQIAAVEAWIKGGAVWPDGPKAPQPAIAYKITPEQRAFWSFQPIRKPAVPSVRDTQWARSDIDRFILNKLEEQKMTRSPQADRRTLIRRATFDLTGLPPTPAEVRAFENDKSPDAFAKVVDRLLASPRYGERWGRLWLDVARYSDDKLNSERDEPYENSFRYRDWVIKAMQEDMPYNTFVKAQIAGDLMPNKERYEAGLGFYALSPEFQDDRVDATTRGFLGLTVACAQCHNHKYDPIPTQDYYSLLGIFNNTSLHETPLAPKPVVDTYQEHKKEVDEQKAVIDSFIAHQSEELSGVLAAKTSAYLLAASSLPAGSPDKTFAAIAEQKQLDCETLMRWSKYLAKPKQRHPFLDAWYKAASQKQDTEALTRAAKDFEQLVFAVNKEKKQIDDENHIRLGLNPSRSDLSSANLASLARDKYVLWDDLFGNKGIYHYGDPQLDRFLSGVWSAHLQSMRAELAVLQKQMPPHYPYLQTIADNPNPVEQRVWIRGSRDNPGEPAPPHFLAILSNGEPKRFTKGAERLELADAIIDPKNPLTARVIVNRVWQWHFGKGLVRTPSNFGKQGDVPSHPELLDFLATRFVAEGWSIKKLNREIMLSSTYALSAANSEKNYAADPDNRLLWRANRRRLDAESLRDSLLLVSGKLDLKMGGPAVPFTNEDNDRRTVYGFVSRRRLDPFLALFDFPNPIVTSEQRLPTTVPLQALFFMNSEVVMASAKSLASRVTSSVPDDTGRIDNAYELLFQRKPTAEERALGLKFMQHEESWPRYMQVLLSSNEFSFLN
jgi:mono/diheme cytochrome c family protein